MARNFRLNEKIAKKIFLKVWKNILLSQVVVKCFLQRKYEKPRPHFFRKKNKFDF